LPGIAPLALKSLRFSGWLRFVNFPIAAFGPMNAEANRRREPARRSLNLSVNYNNIAAAPGTKASVKIGEQTIAADSVNLAAAIGAAVKAHGYPASADPNDINYVMMVLLLTILVVYVTMVYGPIAAWLVELFPTRIRYSGLSLPYNIGNGWFGGFLPATAFAIVAATANIYSGLWYPIIAAAMSFFVALFFLPKTKDRAIDTL
jgi:hypothetical protein